MNFHLSGPRTTLLPVTPRFYDYIYDLATDESLSFSWRLAGNVPSKRQFSQSLSDGVLAQFVVVRKQGDRPIGLVQSYKADLHHGYAYLGGVFSPELHKGISPIEGFVVFMNYLLDTWNLRKLYFEYPEYNEANFRRIRLSNVVEEARLTDYSYYKGRYWDWIITSLSPRGRRAV
jgi:RimJ/RimL family protein N-acetyltransferase